MDSPSLVPSPSTWDSRSPPASSHPRAILARPRYALFPAKLCFISQNCSSWHHSGLAFIPAIVSLERSVLDQRFILSRQPIPARFFGRTTDREKSILHPTLTEPRSGAGLESKYFGDFLGRYFL